MYDHPNSRILTWHFVLPFSSPFLDSPPRFLHHACSSVYLCISGLVLYWHISLSPSLFLSHMIVCLSGPLSLVLTPPSSCLLFSLSMRLWASFLGYSSPSLHPYRLLFLSRSLFLSFLCLPSRCLHVFLSSLRIRFSLYPQFLPVYIHLFLFNPSHANLIFPSFLSPIYIHLSCSSPVSVSLSASLSYLPLFSIFTPRVLFEVLSILLFFVIHLLFTPPYSCGNNWVASLPVASFVMSSTTNTWTGEAAKATLLHSRTVSRTY